jgi:hypothetical protein
MATLIRNDPQAEVFALETNDETDMQEVTAWKNGKSLKIYNLYNPPNTKLNLKLRLTSDLRRTVIAGDANGHTPLLGCKDKNATGVEIEELTNSSTLILLQSTSTLPTLLHRTSGATSRPDISLVSADIHSR